MAPGTEFTNPEKVKWVAKTTAWIRKRKAAVSLEGPQTKKGRIFSTPVHIDRKASFEWMCDLDNACESSWGFTIGDMIPPEKAWDAELEPFEELPKLLVLTNDELQVQWCAEYFMERKLKASICPPTRL